MIDTVVYLLLLVDDKYGSVFVINFEVDYIRNGYDDAHKVTIMHKQCFRLCISKLLSTHLM